MVGFPQFNIEHLQTLVDHGRIALQGLSFERGKRLFPDEHRLSQSVVLMLLHSKPVENLVTYR